MTHKHTPAPWHIGKVGSRPAINSKSFGRIALLGDFFVSENGYSENEANANLISAAPELLEALERFKIAFEAYANPNQKQAFCGILASANEAIKKAKGE